MPASNSKIHLKRIYDEPASSDGTRVLVDRLWPRGLTKEAARVDTWLRDLAPSNELRKWFHTHPNQWAEFRRRYAAELSAPEAAEALHELGGLLSTPGDVTLLYASKNTEQNNAIVLKEMMEGNKKPPRAIQPAPKRTRSSRRPQRQRTY